MMYLGTFAFDMKETKKDFSRGNFQCLVNAKDVEDAGGKFEKFLVKAKKKIDCLKDIKKIFLYHIHEIKNVPQNPVLINFKEHSTNSNYFGSISCEIPKACKGVGSFTFHQEDEKEDELKPFLTF